MGKTEVKRDGFKVVVEGLTLLEAHAPVMRVKMNDEDRSGSADVVNGYLMFLYGLVLAKKELRQVGRDYKSLGPNFPLPIIFKERRVSDKGFKFKADDGATIQVRDQGQIAEEEDRNFIADRMIGLYLYILEVFNNLPSETVWESPREQVAKLGGEIRAAKRIAEEDYTRGLLSQN